MIKILLFIFLPFISFAQGFDWQYSDRMPFEMPQSYLGVYGNYSKGNFNNSISLKEGTVHCCDLANGISANYAFGLASEFYLESGLFSEQGSAISISLGYQKGKYDFNRIQSLPKNNNVNLITKFESNTDFAAMNLKIAWKNRIPDNFVYFELGLWSDYTLSHTNSNLERVLSPSNFDFGNGQTVRTINGSTDEIKKINFGLYASVGYDLNLGLGKYISPYLEVYPPMFSSFQMEKNAIFQYKFGTKLLFAL